MRLACWALLQRLGRSVKPRLPPPPARPPSPPPPTHTHTQMNKAH
jgi:hypothetical protein